MISSKQIIKIVTTPRMLVVAILGTASGLIPALIGGTLLQAWMSEAKIDIKTIGLLTTVAIPYTFKFLWSPLLDRFSLPFGKRKGWILLSLCLLVAVTFYMSTLNPAENLGQLVKVALVIAYLGATLDIALDAWRREYLATDDEIALGLSANTTTYLVSFRLIGGSLALILADHFPWSTVYKCLALVLVPSIIAILLSDEPTVEAAPPKTFYDSVVHPFMDYFSRKGAVFLLLFILLYKLGDNMGGALTTKYFLDMQYTKTEIGLIGKTVGWAAIALGSLAGGVFVLKLRLRNSLFIFGIFQGISTSAFALLSSMPHAMFSLGSVIAFENFTAGLGGAAFATLIARLTNKKFTATQYALLTSAMGVPRYLSGAPTGYMVEAWGWTYFFIVCGLVAIPGTLMSLKIKEDKNGYITV